MKKLFLTLLLVLFVATGTAFAFTNCEFDDTCSMTEVTCGGCSRTGGFSADGSLHLTASSGDIHNNTFTPAYIYQTQASGDFDVYTKMDVNYAGNWQGTGIIWCEDDCTAAADDHILVAMEQHDSGYDTYLVKHTVCSAPSSCTSYETVSTYMATGAESVYLRLKRASGKYQAFFSSSAPTTWDDWTPLSNPTTVVTASDSGRLGLFGKDVNTSSLTADFDFMKNGTWTADSGVPISVNSTNPLWFDDPSGNPLYLTGHATRNTLQDYNMYHNDTLYWVDITSFNYVSTLNWSAYLTALSDWNMNYVRLWTTLSAGAGEDYQEYTPDQEKTEPIPYARISTDNAAGAVEFGKKVNLYVFDQNYFDRMRSRILELQENGIYVSLFLFDAWNTYYSTGGDGLGRSFFGHCFRSENNENSVDVDVSNCGGTFFSSTSYDSYKQNYVNKVIATTHDLDNVIYEISNEVGRLAFLTKVSGWISTCNSNSGYPTHLIHMSPGGYNATCGWDSDAMSPAELIAESPDLISNEGGMDDWPECDPCVTSADRAAGDLDILLEPLANLDDMLYTGYSVMPIVNDTDHLGATDGDREEAPLISLIRGYHYNIQDEPYDYTGLNDHWWDDARFATGKALYYTEQFADLEKMVPQTKGTVAVGSLSNSLPSTTGYCLHDPTNHEDYLVYQPDNSDFYVYLAAGTYSYSYFLPESATPSNSISAILYHNTEHTATGGNLNISTATAQLFGESTGTADRPDREKIVLWINRTGGPSGEEESFFISQSGSGSGSTCSSPAVSACGGTTCSPTWFNTSGNWDSSDETADKIDPGDRVYLCNDDGNITDQLTFQGSGTSGNEIVLTANETVTIDRGGSARAIDIQDLSYITIDGADYLTITDAGDGIRIVADSSETASNITIKNTTFDTIEDIAVRMVPCYTGASAPCDGAGDATDFSNITIGGAEGDGNTFIDVGTTTAHATVYSNHDAEYVTVSWNEFYCTASSGYCVTAVHIGGGDYWTVEYNYVHDFYQAGSSSREHAFVFKWHATNNVVRYNWVNDTNSCIYFQAAGSASYPTNNYVYGNWCQNQHKAGVSMDDNTTTIGGGGGHTEDNWIWANVFIGADRGCWMTHMNNAACAEGEDCHDDVTDNWFYNNTCIQPADAGDANSYVYYSGFSAAAGETGDVNYARNNIVYQSRNNATTKYEFYVTPGHEALSDFDYNLYYGVGGTTRFYYDSASGRTLAYIQSASTTQEASGGLAADPLFTNVSGGDYTLQGSSPAIDSGVDISDEMTTAGTTVNTHTKAEYGLHPNLDGSSAANWFASIQANGVDGMLAQNSYGSGWERGAFVATGFSYYVRPSGACTYNGDGTAYTCAAGTGQSGAWIGITNVDWNAVDSGNGALYIAGTHAISATIEPNVSGESGTPIGIRSCEVQYGASTNDAGTLDRNGTLENQRVFRFDGDDYFEIQGFTIQECDACISILGGADHITIEDVTFTNIGNGVIANGSTGAVSDVTIDDCSFTYCQYIGPSDKGCIMANGNTSNITITDTSLASGSNSQDGFVAHCGQDGCSNFLVSNFTCTGDNWDENCLDWKGVNGGTVRYSRFEGGGNQKVVFHMGTKNVNFYGNLVKDGDYNGLLIMQNSIESGGWYSTTEYIYVYGNLFIGNYKSGIGVSSGTNYYGGHVDYIYIENNTFIDNGTDTSQVYYGGLAVTYGDHIEVVDNLFQDNYQSGKDYQVYESIGSNFVFNYNTLYDSTASGYDNIYYNGSSVEVSTVGSNNAATDPGFTNPPTDLTLDGTYIDNGSDSSLLMDPDADFTSTPPVVTMQTGDERGAFVAEGSPPDEGGETGLYNVMDGSKGNVTMSGNSGEVYFSP